MPSRRRPKQEPDPYERAIADLVRVGLVARCGFDRRGRSIFRWTRKGRAWLQDHSARKPGREH